jgi:hypothetical protein
MGKPESVITAEQSTSESSLQPSLAGVIAVAVQRSDCLRRSARSDAKHPITVGYPINSPTIDHRCSLSSHPCHATDRLGALTKIVCNFPASAQPNLNNRLAGGDTLQHHHDAAETV